MVTVSAPVNREGTSLSGQEDALMEGVGTRAGSPTGLCSVTLLSL